MAVRRAVAAGGETRTTIVALNEQVERIGVVADMISEIAAKTNLLANFLNRFADIRVLVGCLRSATR